MTFTTREYLLIIDALTLLSETVERVGMCQFPQEEIDNLKKRLSMMQMVEKLLAGLRRKRGLALADESILARDWGDDADDLVPDPSVENWGGGKC